MDAVSGMPLLRLGLTTAVFGLLVGGVMGEHWFGKDNIMDAVLLGASAIIGQSVNGVITPTATLVGDTRISPSLWGGLVYMVGSWLWDGRHMNKSLFKDFGYGAVLTYGGELFTYGNIGSGVAVSLNEAAQQVSYNTVSTGGNLDKSILECR